VTQSVKLQETEFDNSIDLYGQLMLKFGTFKLLGEQIQIKFSFPIICNLKID
jgi:hypothetical protein